MKKDWRAKTMTLGAAALLLTAGVSAGRTMAYFTTYAGAAGSVPVRLGYTRTELLEEVKNQGKYITVVNSGDCTAFVRARLFAGGGYEDGLVLREEESNGWSLGADGYYYYAEALEPGAQSGTLCVGVDWKDQEGEFNADRTEFNVIVVQESSRMFYDSDGNMTCDWNDAAEMTEVQG